MIFNALGAIVLIPNTNYLILEKMAKIRVKKVKSAINRTKTQKRTLESLGLYKMNQVVEHDDTPSILGMINKVQHLVSVEETK